MLMYYSRRKKSVYIAIIMILMFIFSSLNAPSLVYAEENWPQAPAISAEAAIVVEADSGAILYEKNSHDQHYPASITKIMTTLLALENCPLTDTVHFSKDAVYKVEGTQVGITPDEDVQLDECLYGIMLASGNEIAYAVAEHVGGTLDNFVDMMNKRATELGCTNTHFNNPHGLPDENHYTCAYDMALIARTAYKIENFRTISGTKYHIIPPTNIYPEERAFSNHHKMLTNSQYHYDYCTGGKTGYTNAARYNLVTFAEKDGMSLICVIMKDDQSQFQYEDTTNLFNYCFDNFHKVDIKDTELGNNLDSSGLFPLDNNVFPSDNASISFEENASLIVPNTVDISQLTHNVEYKDNSDGNTDAYIQYKYDEHLLGDIPVIYQAVESTEAAVSSSTPVANNNSNYIKINVRIILYIVLGIIAVALIALLVLRFVLNHHFAGPLEFQKKNKRQNKRK